MAQSTLSVNNLGGVGPDTDKPEEFRLHDVGSHSNRVLDLVITVAPGSDYNPNLRLRNNNGMNCGNLNQGNHSTGNDVCREGGNSAQINLGSGIRGPTLGEEVTLDYSFVYHDTEEAAIIPGFYISFLDIDESRNKNVREKIFMKDFDEALVEDGAEIKIGEEDEDGWTSYSSMVEGFGCDNPVDPQNLGVVCGVDQRNRAVTVAYSERSTFQVRFQTVCSTGCQARGKSVGRNFLFSFKSSLTDLC